MPKDDHSSGQQHDDSKKPQEGQKPSEKQHGQKNPDGTVKMWQKIEGAVAKDKIEGIKREFDQQDKPRRRRRRRKKREGVAAVPGVDGARSQTHGQLKQREPVVKPGRGKEDEKIRKVVKNQAPQPLKELKHDLKRGERSDKGPFSTEIGERGNVKAERQEDVQAAGSFSKKEVKDEQRDVPVGLFLEDEKEDVPAVESFADGVGKTEDDEDVPDSGSFPEEAEKVEEQEIVPSAEPLPSVEKPEEQKDVSSAEPFLGKSEETLTPTQDFSPIDPFSGEPKKVVEEKNSQLVEPFSAEAEKTEVRKAGAEPINPFAFPTPAYEPKEQAKKVEENKKVEEEKEIAFAPKADLEPEIAPIDPFAIPEPAKPLEERAFDKKPLDNIGRVAEPEAVKYEEERSPEDQDEVHETRVNLSSEDRREEEDRIEPVRKEIIDVPADEFREGKIEPMFPENIDKQVIQNGGFKDDFWNVLQQAGISRKKAFTILIAVLSVIVLGLFFLFGGYKLFFGEGEGAGQPEPEIVERGDSGPVGEVDSGIKVSRDGDDNFVPSKWDQPYDIIAAYIFGLEFTPEIMLLKAEPISSFGYSAGVEAGFIFGGTDDLKVEQFVGYVRLLERMNNIYNADIYALVDLAVDRRAALDNLLKEMNDLISEGLIALTAIETDLAALDMQYDLVVGQINQYETAFFSYLQNYYGQTAHDTLQDFTNATNEAGKIKAQYSAKNTLRTMFINSLNLLRPRYQDIAVNTEALIKGVKVFDIPKSDIDAIITLP